MVRVPSELALIVFVPAEWLNVPVPLKPTHWVWLAVTLPPLSVYVPVDPAPQAIMKSEPAWVVSVPPDWVTAPDRW